MAIEKKKAKSVKIDYAASDAPRKKKKKKLSAESSESEPKKKKKKPSLETSESEPKKKKKKTEKGSLEGAKRKKEKLQAAIATDLALIENLPAVNSQEKAQLDEYLHMFQQLAKLIRKSEKECMKSGNQRDYYALCTLMSQQREVIADIRSVSDMSGQVTQLDQNLLQPMTRSIGQNMLDGFYQIRKLIMESTRPEETQFALTKLNEITQEQGKFLQNQYATASEKIQQIMLG
jgi:hypothetical protein